VDNKTRLTNNSRDCTNWIQVDLPTAGFRISKKAYSDQVKNGEFSRKTAPFSLKTLILIWCVFSDMPTTLRLKVRMAMY
jgi:hypothetical protein